MCIYRLLTSVFIAILFAVSSPKATDTIVVPAGGDLHAAITSAPYGDTVVLHTGANCYALVSLEFYEELSDLWHFALRLILDLLYVGIALAFVLAGAKLKNLFIRLFQGIGKQSRRRNKPER